MSWSIVQADAIDFLRAQSEGSLDLVFGSPPYEQARLYLEDGQDLAIARDTEEWVAWMVEVFQSALHACKGLVAFVVEGQTRGFRYSAGPALLMADLHRAGVHLRKPPIYHRVGIPGSGGPDWLRNDWEWIVCATSGGKLPWSDNTAMGHPPVFLPGGTPSHRLQDGRRVSKTDPWGKHGRGNHVGGRTADGAKQTGTRTRRDKRIKEIHQPDTTKEIQHYQQPAIANPGNVISLSVGGGQMGHPLAHDNEAPFPEDLVAFFVQSFAPPGGLVCDPFSGSGTTASVCKQHGRNFAGCDLRQSQVDLGLRRLAGVTPSLFA